MQAPVSTEGWQARLDLEVDYNNQRSRLLHRQHRGPLQVQRPFYPEADGTCHLYILHPPGGVVGGDQIELNVNLHNNSSALLTTPAAGKFYRSAVCTALQQQHFHSGANSCLEWLPQENILYDGARLDTLTHINLDITARCIAWEIVCLGRPAAGEVFQHGSYLQSLQLWRQQRPLLIEQTRLSGDSELLHSRWGLTGQAVFATLIATSDDLELPGLLRQRFDVNGPISITQRDGLILARYLGPSANEARRCFVELWSLLRPVVLGKTVCSPRIWST